MALSFLTSSDLTLDVVVTCDPSVTCNDEQRDKYLETGDLNELDNVGDEASRFTLKALSPAEREQAETAAGALTRSELGRLLWNQTPDNDIERANWHHQLSNDERSALADYQNYLNRVYLEMIRISLQSLNDEPVDVDQLQLIRPEAARLQTITELVLHVQRISLVGIEGK